MDACRVWADIDLDALDHNLGVIRERIGPTTALLLVVKADAYGHGAVAVGHRAVRSGAAALGVGTSAEALELRHAGITVPVLVLGTILDEEAPFALLHDVHFGIHATDRCRHLQELGRSMGRIARVHLNVDTGMGRLGVLPERALDLLELIHASSHLELCGVMTHVSSPRGLHDPHTHEQLARFDRVVAAARARGLLRGWVHAANSACIFSGMQPLGDAVRPGIGAYGILPEGVQGAELLRPVLSLETRVVFLKDLPPGATVGYGQTFRAARPSRIATLPVGYNDGVHWRLGNRGEVLVRGRRAPIVGAVSMDYVTVDVTDVPGVAAGDRVTLIGAQGDDRIDLNEVARWAGTIPYEITCAVGKRVTRICRDRAPGPEKEARPWPAPLASEV